MGRVREHTLTRAKKSENGRRSGSELRSSQIELVPLLEIVGPLTRNARGLKEAISESAVSTHTDDLTYVSNLDAIRRAKKRTLAPTAYGTIATKTSVAFAEDLFGLRQTAPPKPQTYHKTKRGRMMLGDSLDVLADMRPCSVDLVMTSPPFGLVRKKQYGNVTADEYINWFRPFAKALHRVLTERGSAVIDIGGVWNQGQPTRHLYHFKLLIMMCEEFGFHLAQDFYWWNPSKLPTPAEWVTVRRVRVKDAINTIWWLSKTPWPKANNRRVLQPYSPAMRGLLERGYKAKKRPSGHDISEKFAVDNGAAIPPNLIAMPNTESNSFYLRYCQENKLPVHPARYPAELPEYFIRMLTDPGDLVVDPFAGSCVTGEVAQRLGRRWVCVELIEEYLKGGLGRFARDIAAGKRKSKARVSSNENYYRVPRPGLMWSGQHSEALAADGGETRKLASPARTAKRLPLKATGLRRKRERTRNEHKQ